MSTIRAGDLKERIALERRMEINPDAPNDYGNTVGGWVSQGEVWAQYVFLRGGEAVIAGRLQGRQPVVVRVRASALTRQVAPEWRVRDVRSGVIYAVRSVTETADRAAVEVLAESGVAA